MRAYVCASRCSLASLPTRSGRRQGRRIPLSGCRSSRTCVIAARFHNTVADMIVEACASVRRDERLGRVCLSGGTFQNFTLLGRTVAGMRRQGFEVFLHAETPPNDGGLSLGQAVIAADSIPVRPKFGRVPDASA